MEMNVSVVLSKTCPVLCIEIPCRALHGIEDAM